VPLSERALAIVRAQRETTKGGLVFPGLAKGRPLAAGTLIATMARMGHKDLTLHGFRSTFRDWCGDESHFPREVAEAALAHLVGDRAERAYRRGDALKKRRELMEAWEAWSAYCGGGHGAEVIPLGRRA
jgi:integrase